MKTGLLASETHQEDDLDIICERISKRKIEIDIALRTQGFSVATPDPSLLLS